MANDGFNLTPIDVRSQQFRKAVRGYHPEDVEEFRERAADELERQLRERSQLEERLANFREQLKAYRDREKAMNEAMLAAQDIRVQVEEAAGKEAELMIREAQSEADKIVSGARELEFSINKDVETVQRQFSAYVSAFRRLLERQMSEVDALVEYELDGSVPRRGQNNFAPEDDDPDARDDGEDVEEKGDE